MEIEENKTKDTELNKDNSYQNDQEIESENIESIYYSEIQTEDAGYCECMVSPSELERREKSLNEIRSKTKSRVISKTR